MPEPRNYFATVAKSFADAPYGSSFIAGAVGILGLVYAVVSWLIEGPSTAQVLVAGPLAVVVLVSLTYLHGRQAWQTERARVSELERKLDETQPRFEMHECGIRAVEPGPEVDWKTVPYQFVMVVLLRSSESRRPAYALKGRMVVTDASLKIPPMIDTPIDSGYSETRIFHTKLPLIIQSDIPMQFLAFRFDYVDRATGRELSQRFYYKWEGSKRGFFHNEFFGLSTTDTDKFVAYLRTQLGRWDL